MSIVVVGLGEIGSALYSLFKKAYKGKVYGYDIDPAKTVDKLEDIGEVDYMHIAIPYTKEFVNVVADYAERLKAKHIVIHSTVAPGTTRRVWEETGAPTAYSPTRGRHPCIRVHLLFWPKWVAALPGDHDVVAGFAAHLFGLGLPVKAYYGAPETLELAKLWETVYRAVMIAAWQELHRAALKYGADIEVIADFIDEVHRVLGDRPVYYPDYIGGHCLIPNTEIFNEVYPSKLFEFVLESNEKRRRELSNPDVAAQVWRMRLWWTERANNSYYGCGGAR